MARKGSTNIRKIAVSLVGGKPLAYKLREDGSLVVIGPDGRKSHFTASEVRAARRAEEDAHSDKTEQRKS